MTSTKTTFITVLICAVALFFNWISVASAARNAKSANEAASLSLAKTVVSHVCNFDTVYEANKDYNDDHPAMDPRDHSARVIADGKELKGCPTASIVWELAHTKGLHVRISDES